MELELQHQTLEGFYPIYHTVQGQEETQETIVPDAFPDVARIVSATGQVFLKEKEAGEGSVRLTGTVHASVLYIPENEECVRALNIPIPFQCVKDCPKIYAGMTVHAVLSMAFADARVINPRKLLVRSNLVCDLTVYDKKSETVTCDVSCGQNDGMEKKITHQICHTISEIVEKPFMFSDVLRPGASKPAMDELLSWRVVLTAFEGKVIGAKLVCKGELQLSALYLSGDKVMRADFELPFSQVSELVEETPEGAAELLAVLKNMDCRLREGELEVSVELLLQGCIWVQRDLTVMSDAYCTAAAVETEYAAPVLCISAEQAVRRETARQFCPSGIPGKEVVDCCVTISNLSVGQNECAADLNAEILYLSEDGALCGVNYTIPVSCMLPEERECRCYCRPVGAVSAVPVTGGLEVRADVEFSWLATKATPVNYVSDIKEQPISETAVLRPSVVIRMMGQHESLWDVAKSCHSTVTDICNANGLLSESVPLGTMLLIPSKRI